jgi:hypothetical protein
MRKLSNISIMCCKSVAISAVTIFMLSQISPCRCGTNTNSSYNNAIKHLPNSINSNKINSESFHGPVPDISNSSAHFNFQSSAALPSESSTASSISDGNQNGSQQVPLVRLPSNTLLKYTAYKGVSILHFRIPTDTRSAVFSFKAYEESKSAFSKYF